jgi:hypothetical protein
MEDPEFGLLLWLLSEHHVPVWEYNRCTEGEKMVTRLQHRIIMEARALS